MLLFEKRFHEGLKSGAIVLTFRAWPSARVKPGGRYRCHPIGVLEVDSIERVRLRDIGDGDARRAGFESLAELKEYLRRFAKGSLGPATELWKVELHYGGDGDRVTLALEDRLSTEDVAAIERALAKLDSKRAWTAATLSLIRKQPRTAASKLAESLGRETKPFKADVVKLKRLGLTQSFEVGYELSPRGVAFLAAASRVVSSRVARRP